MNLAITRLWCYRLGLMLAVTFALPPGATLAAPRFQSVSELAVAAETVAAAEILSMTSEMVSTPEGRFPFILYRARTLKLIAGNAPAVFTLRLPGLLSAARIVAPADAPALAPGTKAVMFLKTARFTAPAEAVYEPVCPAQAIVPLIETGPGLEPLALVSVERPAGPGRERAVRVRLQDLGAQIKAARQNRGGQR